MRFVASRRALVHVAALLFLLLFPAYRVAAQGWQHVVNLGGLRGSAVGGGSGNTLYAGLGAGPVLRSDDNGLTWVEVNTGLVDAAGGMLLPKAFVTTPSGRVIRGGDNASWQNRVGSPIFHTDDRGARWNESLLPFGSSARNPAGIGVSDIVLHQGAVYFSDVLSEGVWKSTDDGATWTAVGGGLPTPPFVGFAKTYYAIASAGDALLTVEATRGVFRSIDGGSTWVQSVTGIPGVANSPLLGGWTWNGVDVAGQADGTAFAVVDSRVFRSRDGGATWAEVGAGLIMGPNPFVPSVIQPTARKVEVLGDRVYVTTTDGNPRFLEGTARGDSWTELPRIAVGGEVASILGQSFAAHNGALYAVGSNGIHRLDLSSAVRTPLAPLVTTTLAGPFGVNVGGILRAAVSVQGTAPFTFEWRVNGQPIAGQTSSQLTFTATHPDQSGPVTVVVGNAAGSVTHAVGALMVAPIAAGAVDYAFRPVVSGNGIGAATVSTFAFGPDGSVFVGGALTSQAEAYTGVRKVFADGRSDTSFLTGSATGSGSGPGASVGSPHTVLPLGDGSVLVGAGGVADGTAYYRRLLPDGSADPEWPWPAEIAGTPRKIVRLADGRFLVAGGSLGGIHRLHADGTFDASFEGPATIGRFQQEHVRDFAVLPDGGILIAGVFSSIDGVPRVGLARLLPGGALDHAWVPASLGLNSEVSVLAVLGDGRILIGGVFESVGGQAHRNLALLKADGSVDGALADLIPLTSPRGLVQAFAVQPDGRVWVGGSFTGVAGRTYLFRLNTDFTVDTGFPDLGFVGGRDGGVRSLAWTPDGRLWIGCGVTRVGAYEAGQLFRIFTDVTGPTVGYAGRDLTPEPGSSATLRGTVTGSYTGLQWRFNGDPIPGATGLELVLGEVSPADSGRYQLAVTSEGGLHVSGPATVRVRGAVVIDRQPAPRVGIVSNAVSFGVSAFGRPPLAFQWFRDGIALGGATAGSLALTNLQLDAAGDYWVRVTAADGSVATTEPAYLTVIPQPGSVRSGFRPALFRTSSPTLFRDIAFVADGRVVVAGNFATVTNGPNALLARLLSDGALDPAFRFDSTGLGEVVAIDVQPDGRLVALVRGTTYGVRRLNEDGSPDPGFAGGPVEVGVDVRVAPDGGVLAIGSRGVFRFDAKGVPDALFAQRARMNTRAESLSVDPAGRIYVSGGFTTVGGQPRPQIVRLFPDGTPDASFAPTNVLGSGAVTALAEGALFGDFNRFLRWDDTGRIDNAYGWSARLAVWDVDPAGGLIGVLPGTAAAGIVRRADGAPALPVANLKVPVSSSGYSFVRVAPDGSYWLALGGGGLSQNPETLLYRLYGSVTPLALVSGPQSQTVDSGVTVTLSASATGTSRVLFQWRRNGVDLAGATNATLVLPDAQPAASGDYTVVVRNRSGELVSRPATLVVLGVPEILGLDGAVSLGIGDPLVLGVSARGVAPLAYQWRRDGVDLAGATGSAYTNRAVRLGDGGAYDVVVSNPLGSVTSGPLRISVSVRPGAVVGSFPDLGFGQGIKELNLLPDGGFLADGRALNRFGEQAFALPLTTTDLRGRIDVDAAAGRIYMVDGPRLAFDLSGVHLVGVPRPSLNMRLVRLEPDGHLLVSDNGVNPSLQRISPAGLVVSNFVPAIRPVIDAVVQPDGRVVVLSFTQRTQSGALVYDTVVARLLADGSNDPSFVRSTNTFPLNRRAEHLGLDRAGRVLVMGGLESFNGVPRSRLVRLNGDGTLDAGFRPPSIDGEVVEVATQLNGRLVIVGAFSNVDGQPRRLVARLNADGSHDPSFQPGTGLTRAAGQNIAFDVKVLPAGEIVVAGTFDAANGVPRRGLVLLAGDTQDLYFNREPADLEVMSGATGELVAEATGTSVVGYQWYRDDVPIAGATGGVLSLGPAHAGVAGEYRVVIRNASGELTSRTAVVAVVVTPVVVAQPTSIVVDDGGTATFTVGANGRRLAYQWLRDGEPVGGGTNSSLTLAGAVASNAGRYSVVVSNPSGSVTSDEARLRVRPALAPVGGIPTDGIVGEVLFETGFAEKSNRFPTIVKGAPTRVDGIQGGQAAQFRSGVDWLQLGTGTAALGGTAYSASFWIWPEEQGSVHVYSLTLFLGTQRREHYLYLGGDDTVVGGQRVFLATRGLTSVHSSDDRAYVPNLMGRWTHVAVVYRGGGPSQANNFTVYLDGVAVPLVNSANTVTGVNSGNGLGMHGPSAAFRLDDFRIYNRGLGADEVARLRDTAPPTPKPAIIAQPAGGSAAAGGAFTFTVGASGSDLFYEWFRGTTSLPEADGPSLTLSALAPVDAGDYRVVISNRGGSAESTPAALAVTAGADGFATWASAAGLAGALAEAGSDPDQDGASNLAEFTYGTSPTLAADRPGFEVSTVSVDGSQYPAIVFRRRQALGDVRMEVEVATGVGFGDATPGQVVSLTPVGDGLDRVVIRGGRPAGSVPAQFFRVTVRR